MMHQPVDAGQGHGWVGEDAVPISEGLICRDGDGASFVSGADQFKEDAGFGLVLGDVGEIIEDDQLVFVEAGDGSLESKFAVGYALAVATQIVVLPWFGLHPSLGENLAKGAVFVSISLLRSYALRRLFERWR